MEAPLDPRLVSSEKSAKKKSAKKQPAKKQSTETKNDVVDEVLEEGQAQDAVLPPPDESETLQAIEVLQKVSEETVAANKRYDELYQYAMNHPNFELPHADVDLAWLERHVAHRMELDKESEQADQDAKERFDELMQYGMERNLLPQTPIDLRWLLDNVAPIQQKEQMGITYDETEQIWCPLHPNDSIVHLKGKGWSQFNCVWEDCPFSVTHENYKDVMTALKDEVHPEVANIILHEGGLFCRCEMRPKMRLSRTSKNPNKVFLSCGLPLSEGSPCGFFQWMHGPLWKPKRKRQSCPTFRPVDETSQWAVQSQHKAKKSPVFSAYGVNFGEWNGPPKKQQQLIPYVDPNAHPADKFLSDLGRDIRQQQQQSTGNDFGGDWFKKSLPSTFGGLSPETKHRAFEPVTRPFVMPQADRSYQPRAENFSLHGWPAKSTMWITDGIKKRGGHF